MQLSRGSKDFPQSREVLQRRRQELERYSRALLSREGTRSTKRILSTAPYPFTSHTRFLRSSLDDKRPSSHSLSNFQRPLTHSTCRGRETPLSVMGSRKKQQSPGLEQKKDREIRKNFLRKGSSIDRKVIQGVLRSKVNATIPPINFSYGDSPANASLLNLIRTQIPKGLRDVVGSEQMIRMTRVLTGVQFKSIDLHRRLQTVMKQRKQHYLSNHIEEDDNLTLKSIKRW